MNYVKAIRLSLAALLVGVLVFVSLPQSISINTDGILSVSLGRNLVSAQTEYQPPVTTKIGGEKYQITINGETIQVGKDTPTFIPEITMYRFGDEAWLKLGEPTVNGAPLAQKNGASTITGNTIQWASKDIQFRFYPKSITDLTGEANSDGFEYDLTIANSKAGTSTIIDSVSFPIQSQGLEFYYQPPLTDEYTNGYSAEFQRNITVTETQVKDALTGEVLVERPIDVVGSYAVYFGKSGHEIGQTNYMTGKAFHIYRPKLIDDAGSTAYANLIVVNGFLTLDFSGIKTWLNKAKYPVVIDPTFGYTSIGASTHDSGGIRFIKFTSPSDLGTITSISARAKAPSGTINLGGAVYSNGSSTPATNLAVDSGNVTVTTTASWWSPNISYVGAASTIYWLAWWGSASTTSYYDAGGTQQTKSTLAYTFENWPASNPTIQFNYDRVFSVYATYTAPASYDISNSPTSKAFGTVAASSTYYADGGAPSNPVTDSDCNFTLTNSGSTAKINIKATNATGGVGWTLTSGSPGSNTFRVTAYYSGQNPASGVVLTTSDQTFIASLAAGTKKWDFKLETGTFTDGAEKTWTITLTAVAP